MGQALDNYRDKKIMEVKVTQSVYGHFSISVSYRGWNEKQDYEERDTLTKAIERARGIADLDPLATLNLHAIA